jgi:hypothetical protein
VPVPDNAEEPVKFKFAIDVVAAAPKVIVLVPIATDELDNEELGIALVEIFTLFPFSINVSIPSPVVNSIFSPSAIVLTVDVSS